MMAFFNGKKKSKILFVAIMVIALMATYAVPMTVFADDASAGGDIVVVDGGGDTPDGDTPDGDTPDGDTPDGDTPDGDTPDGDTPDGDTPDGDTPDGDTPDGDTPDGDTPDGDTPDGDTPDGDTPDGDTPDGDTPDGDTPDGDTPDGDTPGGLEEGGAILPQMMTMMVAPLATVSSTGDGIIPVAFSQSDLPSDLNNYAKYEKIGPQRSDTYTDAETGFQVTLSYGEDNKTVNWTSNYPVNYVLVKGQGSAHNNVYTYPEVGDKGDTGLMAPLHKGDYSRINHIAFYFTAPKQYDISLEKTVSPTTASPGDTVTYTFKVTNKGTKELKNVKLSDNLFGEGWTKDLGTLGTKKGNKTITYTKDYIIPVDREMGSLPNTATVTGDNNKSGDDRKETSATASAVVTIAPAYGITLEKTASPTTASPGDKVTYTFKVTNTGTKKLHHVKISDGMINDFGLYVSSLKAGHSVVFDREYRIPDNTALNSILTNEATVTGKDKEWFGDEVATATDTADVNIIAAYAIELVKTVSVATVKPGEQITYSFTITNTGSKELKNVVLTDSKLGSEWKKEINKLTAGATASFSESHLVPSNTPVNTDYINTARVEAEYKIWHDGHFSFGPKWIPGCWEDEKINAEASATVRIIEEIIVPEEPTSAETVKFFVRTNGPRPTAQGSQSTSNFTSVLETIYITDPAISLSSGKSYVNEFPLDALKGAPDPAVENAVKNWAGYDDGSYTSLISSIMTQLQSGAYNTFLEQFSEQDWHIDWYDLKWENDGWHVDGDIVVDQGEEQPEESIGNYHIEYLVSGSGITVAPSVTASTTASSVIIPAPTRISGFETYVITGKDGYATVGNDGAVTITYSAEHEGTYNITVWYEAATVVVPETPSTPRDRDRTITVADDEIPAAPISPAAIDGEQIVLNDAVPAGPLPKTGGIPSLLLYGLGALLAGGGGALKLRNKKNSEEK